MDANPLSLWALFPNVCCFSKRYQLHFDINSGGKKIIYQVYSFSRFIRAFEVNNMKFFLILKFIILSASLIFPDISSSQEDIQSGKSRCFPRRWNKCGKSKHAPKPTRQPIQLQYANEDLLDTSSVSLMHHVRAKERLTALKMLSTMLIPDSQLVRLESVCRKFANVNIGLKDCLLLTGIAISYSIPSDIGLQKRKNVPEKESSTKSIPK